MVDELADELARLADAAKVGYGLDEGVTIGPTRDTVVARFVGLNFPIAQVELVDFHRPYQLRLSGVVATIGERRPLRVCCPSPFGGGRARHRRRRSSFPTSAPSSPRRRSGAGWMGSGCHDCAYLCQALLADQAHQIIETIGCAV